MTKLKDEMEEQEEASPLTGLSTQDANEFEEHPIWKDLIRSVKLRIARNNADLVHGDITIRAANRSGLTYRSDEALRGGMIELAYVESFMSSIKDEILAEQEEKKLLEEEEING